MSAFRDCRVCGKAMKLMAMPGGRKIWVCKRPTCKNYGKPS